MVRNFRLALRSLRHQMGLSAVIVGMLAVGIGATTALFSLFYQILIQPLAVPAPDQLVNLSSAGPRRGSLTCVLGEGCDYVFSYPMFRDLEARQTALSGLAAHMPFRANVGYGQETIAGAATLVSGQYFQVLQLQPALGRLIGPQDEPKLGEGEVVVLSHEYWQTRFGGNPDVLNKTLAVNGQLMTVVGVAPAGFSGTVIGARPQVFVPLTMGWRVRPTAAANYGDRRAYWLFMFGRVKPDTIAAESALAINNLFHAVLNEFDEPLNRNMPPEVKQQFLQQEMTLNAGARGYSSVPETAGQALTLLLGLTGLVLLIVCVNIANLLLARGASRAGEMAIRASIGASRSQLFSQLFAESLLLAVAGGLASLPLAATVLDVIRGFLPAQVSSQLAVQLSPAAMIFAGALSLITVLAFGLMPAFQATQGGPALVIKEHARQTGSSRRLTSFRRALVTAEIGLSMVLLVLAGLFSESLLNVARVNLGMELDSLVSFTVAPRSNGYSPEQTRHLFDRIEAALAGQPGVSGATSASIAVIGGGGAGNSITIDGSEPGRDAQTAVQRNEVSPSFFKTMSIPLIAGRQFTDADTLDSPKVVLVNQAFLRKFNLTNSSAIGKHFTGFPYDNVTQIKVEIVGVVGDAAYTQVKGEIPPLYFQPRRQSERPGALTYYVRGAVDPGTLLRTIPGVVAGIDRTLPINNLMTMRQQVQDNVYVDRMIAALSSGFAVLATFLAAVGLYGVIAYNVMQRRREFGLRLALGAEPKRLRAMVLRQVALMAAIGSILGLVGALTIGHAAESLLFGLSGRDPRVLAAAAILLSGIVLAAGYLPARRASRTQPMEALRHQS